MTMPQDADTVRKAYNAKVLEFRPVHEELLILRVVPDSGPFDVIAGQYTTLGLGTWEPRIDGVKPRSPVRRRLIRRAYSISCPVLDEAGSLVTVDRLPYLEFYIALVRRPSDDPPMLTPRLFALGKGSRLAVGRRAHGDYTLATVAADDDVLFFATGTGEAPHNAMIAQLLANGHRGRIVSCVTARYRKDLAYRAVHQTLEKRYPHYRYFALTTREPENLDATRSDYVGKLYLQDLFGSGELERRLGWSIKPDRTHAFLCGNPAMIGVPKRTDEGEWAFPEPTGMVELLMERGFRLEMAGKPGNIHFEKYW